MQHKRWLLVSVLVGALACAPQMSTRERMLEQQAVDARLTTWVRVMNNASQDSLFAMYHQVPELQVMWPDGKRTTGWDETQQAWTDFYANTDYMNFVAQSPDVQILSPDVAVTSFHHSMDIVRQRQRLPVSAGYGVVVWVKDASDGLWKIHLSQISVVSASGN